MVGFASISIAMLPRFHKRENVETSSAHRPFAVRAESVCFASGMSDAILEFFRHEKPDSSGRMLRDILAWDDDELEYTHDYIQWLFPNVDPSMFNPDAPTLTRETIAAFSKDSSLRNQLAINFDRMARFYGFDVTHADEHSTVVPAANFNEQTANWLHARNHNLLRITRILKCLTILGQPELARAFFNALDLLYKSKSGIEIGETTFLYWKNALRVV